MPTRPAPRPSAHGPALERELERLAAVNPGSGRNDPGSQPESVFDTRAHLRANAKAEYVPTQLELDASPDLRKPLLPKLG